MAAASLVNGHITSNKGESVAAPSASTVGTAAWDCLAEVHPNV